MIDRYGRELYYLRLSVTELCNLRCRYCMPAEGVCKLRHEEMLTEDEIVRAVRAAASLGMYKVRITGGEPLVKPNILSVCRRVAEVEGVTETVLTTNATRLAALARPLRAAGIRRVNISLDTLNAEKYAFMTRGGVLADAMNGIEAALEAGFEKVKINAVLIGGFNDDEIPALADLTRRRPVDMRFIELMPMPGDTLFGEHAYIPVSRVLEMMPEAKPAAEHDGVAQMYRLPGGLGNIGLISPLSNHFCGNCNRLRLTADGHLKPCLHSREEICIKGMNEEQMAEAIRQAALMKPRQHDPLSRSERSHAARPMNQIGG